MRTAARDGSFDDDTHEMIFCGHTPARGALCGRVHYFFLFNRERAPKDAETVLIFSDGIIHSIQNELAASHLSFSSIPSKFE
jgi:hypothetical protein